MVCQCQNCIIVSLQIYLGREHSVSKVVFTHSTDFPDPLLRYHIQVTVSPYPEYPVLPLIGHDVCYTDPVNQTMPVRVIGECTIPVRGKYVALRKYAPNPDPSLPWNIINKWVLTQVQVSPTWKTHMGGALNWCFKQECFQIELLHWLWYLHFAFSVDN